MKKIKLSFSRFLSGFKLDKASPFFLIYLFLFLYMPPILSFNIVIPLAMVGIVYLVTKFKNIRKYMNQFRQTGFWKICLLIVCGFLYLAVTLPLHGFQLRSAYPAFLISILNVVCLFFIFVFALLHHYDLTDIINMLLLVSLVQCLLSVLTVLIPSLRQMFIQLYLSRGYSSVYTWLDWRLFGFSNELLFSMPIVQSFLALCALFFTFNRSYWYALFLPFLLFSSMMNARIGIVIFGIGFLVLLFFQIQRGNREKNSVLLKSIGIFAGFGVVACALMFWLIPQTGEWFLSMFRDVFELLKGNRTGFFEYMFERNGMTLPTGKDLLLGTGSFVLGGSEGVSSDCGFVNDLWLGGLFYATVMWGSMVLQLRLCFRKGKTFNTYLSVMLFITFLIANFKGPFFTENEMFVLNGILSLFILYDLNIERRETK